MRQDPIRVAFESIAVDPSPVFRDQLRVEFLAGAAQPEVREDLMVKVVDNEVRHGDGDRDPANEVESSSSQHRRMKVVVGVAASIAVVAALAVVIINHQSKPTAVDTSHDVEIANAAIITPTALGAEWTVSHLWGDLTSRSIAESAETVPECEPYLDAAFDTAGRQAVTAGRHFGVPGADLTIWIVTQWVYIFPSERAASEAMDKIAEPGFLQCFDHVFRRMYGNSQAARLDPVSVAAHGDRQIVIGQRLGFGIPTPGGGVDDAPITVDAMNVWVQIGRAVVFIDPTTDPDNSTNPNDRIERAVSAATDALKAALEGSDR